jgi:1-acyl-sn-glycerol-3-phosphate acyltransferase
MNKILYKVYFWVIAMPLFIVITLTTATTVIFGCLLGGMRFFSYYPGMVWSRLACMLTLCPVTVRGRENIKKGESYVFVSNHQGAYDIFAIYGHLGVPIKWMMKKGLAKIPFVGYACRMAGFIFVDNSSARNAQKSVLDAKRNLPSGHSLIIFPEGARTSDGRLQKFKRGAYQIAADLQLPIVPITINGSYKIMRLNSPNIRPHRIEMIIHPPVMPHKKDENDKENMQRVVNETRQTIFSALWNDFKYFFRLFCQKCL